MRNPNRQHDRKSFFKYVAPGTAKAIFENSTLRWSSPILFNDPFDVPREMSFGITPENIMHALSLRMTELIESPPDDTSNLNPGVRLIIETVKKGIPEELKKELIDGIKDVANEHKPRSDSLEELRAMWRAFIPDFRILCLAESPAHSAMWSHYAEQYSGVVFEFRCVDELDSAWLAAKPVRYPKSKPEVYTAAGWAKILTMPNDQAIRTIIDIATFTKSQEWSYEKEWRITSFKRPNDIGHFTDYKFHPDEISAVYLGPMVSTSDREILIKLAENYPKVIVWDVLIGLDRAFHFKKRS